MTTLKSLASWLEVALCDAARPVDRRIAVLPISITLPVKVRFGIASMVTLADWPTCTLTMSVSSTFTSAVISDISAMVMMVDAAEFCTPGTTVSPDAHRQVGDHAIQRRDGIVFGQHVVQPRQPGLRLRDPALGGGELRGRLRALHSHLRQPRLIFTHAGRRRIVIRLFLIVILLGDQVVLVQFLGVIKQHFRALLFRAEPFERRLGGLGAFIGGAQSFFRRRRIGLGGSDPGFLRRHIGLRLHVLDARHHLILADVIAFLDQKLQDPALRVGSDIDVVLRLDFTRSGH